MLVTSFKSRVEAAGVPPTWIPRAPTTQAYTSILGSSGTPVLRWFANSMIAAAANSALVVATAAMAAYPLARMRVPRPDVVFGLIIATLFVPPVILIIPNYLIVGDLKWLDTLVRSSCPRRPAPSGCSSCASSSCRCRRSWRRPRALDGANLFQIFTRVVLPLSKPALVRWPSSRSSPTGTTSCGRSTSCSAPSRRRCRRVCPRCSRQQRALRPAHGRCGIASLPVLILYCFAQRFIIEGVSRSGLKG